MTRSQIAFALGACGGLARILMPSAWNTAPKAPVNWPARSLIRNLMEVARWPRSHQDVAGCLCRPRGVGAGGEAGQVNPPGGVLDDDQGVDAPQEHGARVGEAGREDAAGLGGQELLPGRPGASGCGAGPGIVQDLP